jgi:hypothetical protein
MDAQRQPRTSRPIPPPNKICPQTRVLSVENASAAVFFTSVPPFPLLADLPQEHWYRGSGEMRKLTSLFGPSPEVLAATAGGLALSLQGWWGEINESPAWQDGAFFSLSAAYAFVSAVALVRRWTSFGPPAQNGSLTPLFGAPPYCMVPWGMFCLLGYAALSSRKFWFPIQVSVQGLK